MDIKRKLTIAVDFDGTIVKHQYPHIGEPVPHALEVMKELQEAGNKLILLTMRGHKVIKHNEIVLDPNTGKEKLVVIKRDTLQEAIDYLEDNGIKLDGINNNDTQKHWTDSNKVYANIYIDDAALGCPLIEDTYERPYVDWLEVRRLLANLA